MSQDTIPQRFRERIDEAREQKCPPSIWRCGGHFVGMWVIALAASGDFDYSNGSDVPFLCTLIRVHWQLP